MSLTKHIFLGQRYCIAAQGTSISLAVLIQKMDPKCQKVFALNPIQKFAMEPQKMVQKPNVVVTRQPMPDEISIISHSITQAIQSIDNLGRDNCSSEIPEPANRPKLLNIETKRKSFSISEIVSSQQNNSKQFNDQSLMVKINKKQEEKQPTDNKTKDIVNNSLSQVYQAEELKQLMYSLQMSELEKVCMPKIHNDFYKIYKDYFFNNKRLAQFKKLLPALYLLSDQEQIKFFDELHDGYFFEMLHEYQYIH
ncbi:Hypothetical_protein [Hexamita inflata]|uniref:Hypothetical_protein n=1 Tax=Hexamita inflata TaxID=28002 RepID=A0AA86Q3G3_9EUKA|nr:Hypothetical protein HINF_LOCUS39110 [Hexamita inflata]